MVQVLKQRSGFTVVEILVATIILSIGALAFFAMVKSTTAFSSKARSNDAAYSIARQRLSLMQDGELLVRPEYHDSTERDGTKYYTLDQVDTISADQPLRLTVTVSWGSDPVKSVNISGYLNREICPDTGVTTPPDSITISNMVIPEGVPANTLIGELNVYDPDTSDLHMYLFNDTVQDNEMFKVYKGKLYTTRPLTVGTKTVELGVADCANNETTFQLAIQVTTPDSVPNVPNQSFSIQENRPDGVSVGTIFATPANVTFSTLSQTPAAPFSVGANGAIIVSSTGVLNHETCPTVTIQVEATNLQWHDTGTVTISVTNVNESPSLLTYSGSLAVLRNVATGTEMGSFTVTDPDAGDQHSVVLATTCDAFPYFQMSTTAPWKLLTKSNLQPGIFTGVFIATDAGGLSVSQAVTLTINDTVSTPTCGSYAVYNSSATYNAGDRAYETAKMYIYQAKWWTQSLPTLTIADWQFIGACDGSAACSDFTAWSGSPTEYNTGALVSRLGKIYKALSYSKNKKPEDHASVWGEVSPCN